MNLPSRFSALLCAVLLLLTAPSLHAAKRPKFSKKDQLVTISTSFGDIKLVLFDATPKHKANFLKRAETSGAVFALVLYALFHRRKELYK